MNHGSTYTHRSQQYMSGGCVTTVNSGFLPRSTNPNVIDQPPISGTQSVFQERPPQRIQRNQGNVHPRPLQRSSNPQSVFQEWPYQRIQRNVDPRPLQRSSNPQSVFQEWPYQRIQRNQRNVDPRPLQRSSDPIVWTPEVIEEFFEFSLKWLHTNQSERDADVHRKLMHLAYMSHGFLPINDPNYFQQMQAILRPTYFCNDMSYRCHCMLCNK